MRLRTLALLGWSLAIVARLALPPYVGLIAAEWLCGCVFGVLLGLSGWVTKGTTNE